jgi:ABC-type cobalamin/Fe3+-siderophores transport system ATPase subunit
MVPIEIRDVTLVYDTPGGKVPGVKNVTFNIGASEFLCIVGPSGCGKSTLLNIIAGFLTPASGEIRIGGKPVVAYLKAWLEVAKDFKQNPKKVSDTIYSFYASKGYKMAPETFAKAIARVEVDPSWPADIKPYMQKQAEILLNEKKIKAIPDWDKALRMEFLKQASA